MRLRSARSQVRFLPGAFRTRGAGVGRATSYALSSLGSSPFKSGTALQYRLLIRSAPERTVAAGRGHGKPGAGAPTSPLVCEGRRDSRRPSATPGSAGGRAQAHSFGRTDLLKERFPNPEPAPLMSPGWGCCGGSAPRADGGESPHRLRLAEVLSRRPFLRANRRGPCASVAGRNRRLALCYDSL